MNREDNTSVYSNQSSIHNALAKLVQKHTKSRWREPTPPHDREAMKKIIDDFGYKPSMGKSKWFMDEISRNNVVGVRCPGGF